MCCLSLDYCHCLISPGGLRGNGAEPDGMPRPTESEVIPLSVLTMAWNFFRMIHGTKYLKCLNWFVGPTKHNYYGFRRNGHCRSMAAGILAATTAPKGSAQRPNSIEFPSLTQPWQSPPCVHFPAKPRIFFLSAAALNPVTAFATARNLTGIPGSGPGLVQACVEKERLAS